MDRSRLPLLGGIAFFSLASSLVLPVESYAHESLQSAEMHVSHISINSPRLELLLPKSGSGKGLKGTILVTNTLGSSVTLKLNRVIGLSNSSLPRSINLAARESKKIPFQASINSFDGFSALGVVYDSSNQGRSSALIPIEMRSGQFRTLSPGRFDEDLGIKVLPSSIRVHRGPVGYKARLPKQGILGKDSPEMNAVGQKKASANSRNNSLLAFLKPLFESRDAVKVFLLSRLASASQLLASPASAASGTYTGRFVFQTVDASRDYFPVPGVTVRAVNGSSSCNSSNPLAEARTDSDGNFSLSINSSGPYRICYIANNDFMRVGTDFSGAPLTWASQPSNTIPSSRVVHAPVRHDGVFDMWYESTWFQTSMTRAGVNPAKATDAAGSAHKINVKFPSQNGDCPGATQPWSCASPNGNTYIAPAHIVNHGVLSHELAHQVNNKYTARARGAGGDHGYNQCFDPDLKEGLILREGWANYESARALGSRQTPSYRPDFRSDLTGFVEGVDVELNGATCTGPNRAESVTTSILWDFYDLARDGADTLHYVSPYQPTNIYLGRKPMSPRALFAEIMNDCRAPVNQNQATCTSIFSQNGGSDVSNSN